MIDMDLIRVAVGKGVDLVKKSPTGELPKKSRIELWKSMGLKLLDEKTIPLQASGPIVRYYLERLSFTRMLPSWENHFPNDPLPNQLLTLADQVVFDKSQYDRCYKAYADGWVHAENTNVLLNDSDLENHYICYVCFAACRLLFVALVDEYYNEHDIDDPAYLAFNPNSEDPSLFASWVFSKGTNDPELTRQFWLWYLNTAVWEAVRQAKQAKP